MAELKIPEIDDLMVSIEEALPDSNSGTIFISHTVEKHIQPLYNYIRELESEKADWVDLAMYKTREISDLKGRLRRREDKDREERVLDGGLRKLDEARYR